MIDRYRRDVEGLEKKIVEHEDLIQSLEMQKGDLTRVFEMSKKQLSEKINGIASVLSEERRLKEEWQTRYE